MAHDVLADLEELTALVAQERALTGLGEPRGHLLEIGDVVGRVVGVRDVAGPHEAVAEALGERGDAALVGVAADPAPLLEILARLVLQRYARADERVAVDGVDAIEPV